ncbi:MAG: hypothetical protein Unbinned6201contig1000_17 [Prokaryotic dsDNA virus sp.]|nr:MAG: hypothetical protein Unbinned6201contig1000_17 [Prokaryotic dsDNA virus sp.]|tara:strand:+ start:4934 stop:5326 length:393 start_codon:yes stop_codon:yes gene_type:complete
MIDATQELSQEQVLTSSSADSTNSHNFGKTGQTGLEPFAGGGYSPRVKAVIHTTIVGSGGHTIVAIWHSADDSTYTALLTSHVSTTLAPAGEVILDVGLPPETKQFIKLIYTKGGTVTAGKANAWIYNLN